MACRWTDDGLLKLTNTGNSRPLPLLPATSGSPFSFVLTTNPSWELIAAQYGAQLDDKSVLGVFMVDCTL